MDYLLQHSHCFLFLFTPIHPPIKHRAQVAGTSPECWRRSRALRTSSASRLPHWLQNLHWNTESARQPILSAQIWPSTQESGSATPTDWLVGHRGSDAAYLQLGENRCCREVHQTLIPFGLLHSRRRKTNSVIPFRSKARFYIPNGVIFSSVSASSVKISIDHLILQGCLNRAGIYF